MGGFIIASTSISLGGSTTFGIGMIATAVALLVISYFIGGSPFKKEDSHGPGIR